MSVVRSGREEEGRREGGHLFFTFMNKLTAARASEAIDGFVDEITGLDRSGERETETECVRDRDREGDRESEREGQRDRERDREKSRGRWWARNLLCIPISSF
jgi:hypothetical protein